MKTASTIESLRRLNLIRESNRSRIGKRLDKVLTLP